METFASYDSPPPPLLVFSLVFASVYLLGYFLIFRNWMKHRPEAASCLMSLAHGTPAVFLATYSMLQAPKLSQLSFASPNNDFQNMVLEYSIAYFVMDLLHYTVFSPSEVLFIAHHLATLYVLLTCRYMIRHGAVAILAVLIIAEVTSPCQNTWTLARLRKKEAPEAARLYESLSPIFYAFYSVVRIGLGPLAVFKIGAFFASGAAHNEMIPKWVWISWMIVIGSAIGVSMSWILNLWMEWYKSKVQKGQKKLS